MAATHLQKIIAKAKQIRKASPKMEWKTAVKKASKELAGKKVGAVKKKTAPKKAVRKKTAVKNHVDTKSHNVNIRVVSGAKKPNYKKPTVASNIQHYSWLVDREKGLVGVIEQIKSEKPLTPAKRAEIKSYQKQLQAVRKQKTLQKQLI